MKIIVLTYAKDHFTLPAIDRLVEEARHRGHSIERVRYNECSLTIEDNQPKIYYRSNMLKGVDVVIPWVIQGDFDYGIDVLHHFELTDAFVLNSSTAFLKACHKWRTAQALVRHHISTPDTYFAKYFEHMNQHIDAMASNNAVVKVSNGTKGRGVVLSPDKDTTKAIAAALNASRDESYIVQDFLSESAGVDIRAYVVGDKVIAAMERRAKSGFRSNLHLGGVGTPIVLTHEESALAIKAARALGLNTAGIDFMRGKNSLQVIEANASGGFGIEEICGVNVAEAIIKYVETSVGKNSAQEN